MGTEDYFCGSYNFENKETRQYQEYTTPYAGLAQVFRPDSIYQSLMRFGMYRWHITDPVRFSQDLRVTIGSGLAQRSTLSATAGRHCICSLLVSISANSAIPKTA